MATSESSSQNGSQQQPLDKTEVFECIKQMHALSCQTPPFNKETLPPPGALLSDIALAAAVNYMSMDALATMWPKDFDEAGYLRPDRPNRGLAATQDGAILSVLTKRDGQDTLYYLVGDTMWPWSSLVQRENAKHQWQDPEGLYLAIDYTGSGANDIRNQVRRIIDDLMIHTFVTLREDDRDEFLLYLKGAMNILMAAMQSLHVLELAEQEDRTTKVEIERDVLQILYREEIAKRIVHDNAGHES